MLPCAGKGFANDGIERLRDALRPRNRTSQLTETTRWRLRGNLATLVRQTYDSFEVPATEVPFRQANHAFQWVFHVRDPATRNAHAIVKRTSANLENRGIPVAFRASSGSKHTVNYSR